MRDITENKILIYLIYILFFKLLMNLILTNGIFKCITKNYKKLYYYIYYN